MKPRRALLPSLLVAAALLSACGPAGRRGDDAPSAAATGGEIPSFAVRTVDGKSLRLSDHVGQDVLLLSFWATWCRPCRAEFPFLQQLHETYREQGLAIVAVSMDGPETQAEVRPFLQRNRYTMPAVVDRNGRIAARLNPRSSVPLGILVDRSGRVHRTFEGFQPGEREAIEAEIVDLLGRAPARAE